MMVPPCRVLNTIARCCGIWIDQCMLGIGEVWYFSPKTGVFSRNDGFTMLCDEHHCVLWWYLDWSMNVRNWWGLVFSIENSCFFTKWWFHHAVWWTPLHVVRSIKFLKVCSFVCLLVCPRQSETSFFIFRFFEVLIELYYRLSGSMSLNVWSVCQKNFAFDFFTQKIGLLRKKLFFIKLDQR